MSGMGGKEGTPKWAPNPKYVAPQSTNYERVARLLERACSDCVVAVSSRMLGDDVAEMVVGGHSSGNGRRCYILTSAPKERHGGAGGEPDMKGHRFHGESPKHLGGEALVRAPAPFQPSVILVRSEYEKSGLFFTGGMTAQGLGGGHELLVDLTISEVSDILSVFRWAFWEGATHEVTGGNVVGRRPLGKVTLPKTKKVLLFGPRHTSVRDEVMNMLNDNVRNVVSAGFWWDTDRDVMERLCELKRQGTKVTPVADLAGVTAGSPKAVRNCIPAIGFSEFAAKVLVSDSRALVTSKMQGSGEILRLGLSLSGKRAADVRETLTGWAKNFQYELVRESG